MSSAPAPTQASAAGPHLPRPQLSQASTTGQGSNTVTSRHLLALEDTAVSDISLDVDVHVQPILVHPRLSARFPAGPAVSADVAPAPPRSSGDRSAWSTRGRILQGANSLMIRSLFALEYVVLYMCVIVQPFFVWIFSSVYSRAMNVPGLSNVLRPLSLPGLAAGSPVPLPEPVDVALAPPRASGNYRGTGDNAVMSRPLSALEDTAVPNNLMDVHVQPILVPPRLSTRSPAQPAPRVDVVPAPPRTSGDHHAAGGRSAWSIRGRIVEGLLSTVALVYMLRAWAYRPSALETNLFGFILVVSLTPVVANGFSELRQLWNDPSAVNSRTSDEERNGTLPEYPVLDGVDLFEYDYFQKRYVGDAGKLVGVGVPVLLQLSTVILLLSFVGESFAIALGYVILHNGKPFRPRFDCDLLFSTLKDLCVNQPTSRHVRAFLLAGGMIYAVLLHLSPVPSKWTWSLIVTHSIRLLTVLVTLRGHNQGVADAGAEIVAHVSEVA